MHVDEQLSDADEDNFTKEKKKVSNLTFVLCLFAYLLLKMWKMLNKDLALNLALAICWKPWLLVIINWEKFERWWKSGKKVDEQVDK